MGINVSIVLYKSDKAIVRELLETLRRSACVNEIFLLDNSPYSSGIANGLPVRYIYNDGHNLGYGRAHNIALRQTLSDGIPYHLILNPDIHLDASVLDELLAYMEQHEVVGAVMPQIHDLDGHVQYLCKLLPEPMDLFCRRFLPDSWMQERKRRFDLRDNGYDEIRNVPCLSGCFMLLRTEALKQVGLFDERYFLYMEDVDLYRRLHRRFQTSFYPMATVVHEHTRGSYKNVGLLWRHIVSAFRYFNKWGWVFDKERKEVNERCLRGLT